jgi:AcrR family transcriptional regulator
METATKSAGKSPQQARSRARVARILAASTELIRRHGVADLTMSAVAKHARIPIGSLYQYFPDKSELIHRLYLDLLETYHVPAMQALQASVSPAACVRALRQFVLELYRQVRADPLMRDIWGGLQADREITHLHMKDNEFYTTFLIRMAEKGGSRLKGSVLQNRAVVLNEMCDAVIRLAITLDTAYGLTLVTESISILIRELGLEANIALRKRTSSQ